MNEFIISMHGILNKDKINNPAYVRNCIRGIFLSLIGFIAVIAFGIKWGWR